jgi:AraC family transcriptional regulator
MAAHKDAYEAQINRVTTFISAHIDTPLRLDELARMAGFSPYHFHRIFKNVTGETLNEFVVRRRLERAVALMKADRSARLTQIALACGFSELSDLSRVFKQRYGFPPGAWDRSIPLQVSKIRQAPDGLRHYTADELAQMEASAEFDIQLREVSEQTIAYIRVENSYENSQKIVRAFKDLMQWALAHAPGGRLIGMSEDDPDVTPPAQCRYDVCMTVPDGTKPQAQISIRTLPALRLAVIHCVGDIALVDRAWQYLYRHWLPRSGYLPDNIPVMELYARWPDDSGWEQLDIECAIAVLPVTAVP